MTKVYLLWQSVAGFSPELLDVYADRSDADRAATELMKQGNELWVEEREVIQTAAA